MIRNHRLIIAALATASLVLSSRADITTGLVAQWEFDDGPGSSIAVDSSGTGNDGTLTGFSDTTFTNMWVSGRFGDALLFNTNGDIGDYVSVANASSLDSFSSGAVGTRQFTLAAWVRLSVPGSAQSNSCAIITKGAVNLEQYSLGISNGLFQCEVRNSSGKSGQVVNSTFSPVAGVWYHVVAIWWASPQEHWMYINGAFNNTYGGVGFLTTLFTTNYPLTIGNREVTAGAGFTLPFQGEIDDVRIYNRVLTPSDIYQLYTNGATVANAPSIVTQPRNVKAYLGDTANFSVTFDPNITLLPVGYQWRLNTTNIPSATNSTLSVTNAQATNAGMYSVVITNFEGTAVSSNAMLTLQSLPVANILNNLVGYWKFDDGSGSSNAVDSTSNHNTGVLADFADTSFTSMWTNGILGGALAFNGDASAADVVAVPNTNVAAPAVLDFVTNPVFTISAWVNGPATQSNGAVIISKGTGGGNQEYLLDVTGGAYRFLVRDAGGNPYAAQTAIVPNGQWQLVTGVLNASNGIMNCYVNGQLAASAVAPASLLTNQVELSFGNDRAANGNYQNPFTGLIDEGRVYHRDLTSADVAALYASRPAPLSVTFPLTAYEVVAGANATLAPTVLGGLAPYTYQWQRNGTNITGATKFPLVLTNAGASVAGNYDLILSDSNIVPAVTSSVVSVSIVPYLTFNNNGTTWSAQGTTATNIFLGTNVAQITTLVSGESNSVFYAFPLYVGGFQASFNYQLTQVPGGKNNPGDGVVFCIQNDPRGPTALAYNDTGLGVGDIATAPVDLAIAPSIEFEMNLSGDINVGNIGVSWNTNGIFTTTMPTAPVDLLNTNDMINVLLTYEDGVATATLTDTNTGAVFSYTNDIDIPGAVGGNLAYIGFTASTGSRLGTQLVSDFTYQSLVNLSLTNLGSSAVIAWPTGVVAYALQQNASLGTTNWMNVTNATITINGQNVVTVPITSDAQFFQLVLPSP